MVPRNSENASRWEKTNKYEIVRTAVPCHPVRETVLRSCGVPHPYRLQPKSNTRSVSMVLDVHSKKKKREKKKEKLHERGEINK